MTFENLKVPFARFALLLVRSILREDKESIAKFAVDEVLKDERIPEVRNVGDFVRKNFPARIGHRGF